MASIRKRKNSYQITVSNGYDASGRKLTETATFTPDPTKTEKQNQKALEIFAFEFEQKVRSGNYLDGEKILLKDYAVRWLSEYAEKQLAYSTYSNYKMNIESRIIPSLGHMKMSQIKPLHIQAMYNSLLSDMARNDGKSGRLSTGTIKKVHAILSSMLHTAVLWQIIESNPCDRVAPPASQEQRSTCPKHFTLEQADAFIKALDMDIQTNYCDRQRTDSAGNLYFVGGYQTAKKIPLQIKVFFYMALFGGFRRSEILALTWKDIDFQKNTVDIFKALTLKDHEMTVKTTKTKTSARTVSLPAPVMHLLHQLLIEQKQYALSLGSQWVGHRGSSYKDNYIFIQWNGQVMYLDTPYQWFRKILDNYNRQQTDESAKLPPITMHGLRHTSATLLISQNVDIRTVSGRLGHAQTSTTMNIYAHSLRKSDEAAAESLENLLIKQHF